MEQLNLYMINKFKMILIKYWIKTLKLLLGIEWNKLHLKQRRNSVCGCKRARACVCILYMTQNITLYKSINIAAFWSSPYGYLGQLILLYRYRFSASWYSFDWLLNRGLEGVKTNDNRDLSLYFIRAWNLDKHKIGLALIST